MNNENTIYYDGRGSEHLKPLKKNGKEIVVGPKSDEKGNTPFPAYPYPVHR